MKSEPVSEYENLEGTRARESISTHHREKTVNETAGNADAIHYYIAVPGGPPQPI